MSNGASQAASAADPSAGPVAAHHEVSALEIERRQYRQRASRRSVLIAVGSTLGGVIGS